MNKVSEYISHCKQHGASSIFMEPFWLDSISTDWQVLHVLYNAQHYYLPIVVQTKLGFSLLRNPLFVPYSQVQSIGPITEEVIHQFTQLLAPYHMVELHLAPGAIHTSHWSTLGFTVTELHTNYLSLNNHKEILFGNFKDSCKRHIKKAELHLTIESSYDSAFAYQIIETTFAKQDIKMPYAKKLINQMANTCKEYNCGIILKAIDKTTQENTAMLWLVWDKNKMYYLSSGIKAISNNAGAVNLLVWHALQLAIEKGCTIFDFEGSRHKGIDTFFKTFGSKSVPYSSISKYNSILLKTALQLKNKLT